MAERRGSHRGKGLSQNITAHIIRVSPHRKHERVRPQTMAKCCCSLNVRMHTLFLASDPIISPSLTSGRPSAAVRKMDATSPMLELCSERGGGDEGGCEGELHGRRGWWWWWWLEVNGRYGGPAHRLRNK